MSISSILANMKAFGAAVSGIFMLVLVMQSSVTAQDPQNDTAELQIREAIVRFQIKTWELAADSYCISINGKDPPEEFLKRFRPLPVKGESGCRKKTIGKVQMSILDKSTGKHSVIFDLGTIRWLPGGEVEVNGGYLCGSLCMAEGSYHVVQEPRGWTVTKFEQAVIS
jgi:hypothetical protein